MAESLPPLTVDDLLTALDNPHFSSYLYFGRGNENGWKVAIGAQRFTGGLRVYRISQSEQSDVKRALGINGKPKAVVLDFGRTVIARLTKSECEDPFHVLEQVAKA